jgi:hypothetical protein
MTSVGPWVIAAWVPASISCAVLRSVDGSRYSGLCRRQRDVAGAVFRALVRFHFDWRRQGSYESPDFDVTIPRITPKL